MYSLYRAWFGDEETYPRFDTLSPPDTLVRVGNEGEHQFVAHRGVLAAHSGYLKALLATATNSTTTSGHDEAPPTVTSISVSLVGGEAFAPLLNYMYTGRLEVTLENIYSVLLATHLLHMPGALEQCRAALLRLRGPPPPLPTTSSVARPGTILRPVPNRLVGPPLCWSQPTLYPPGHVALSHLPNFQLSPSLSILSNPGILQEPTTVPYSFRENTPSPPPVALELRRSQNAEIRATSPHLPSTSCRLMAGEKKLTIDEIEENDKKENDRLSVVESLPSAEESNERTTLTINNEQTTSNRRINVESPRSRIDGASPSTSTGTGVIYDIACCDGPVRFHRVLNENYVATDTSTNPNQQRPRTNCPIEEDLDVDEIRENDENGKPDGNLTHEARSPSVSSNTGSYTCGYCRHTFKSHYCYRKHARRHLLPTTETTDGISTINSRNNRPDSRQREVRLLDLNVQYYPCKICGSKFPSYYFVHKHKKLCHANVEENSLNVGDGETSSVVAQGNSSDP